MLRTHTCGELREAHVGETVTLCGWVWKSRDLGGLLFVDLRDRYGFAQLVFDPAAGADLSRAAAALRGEDVVAATGEVRLRPEGMRRADAPTGAVEVAVSKLEILARAKTPPFNLAEETLEVHEELRLEYRYLDLRRRKMLGNLEVRHRAVQAIREYLSGRGFLEVETPALVRSTPEGARDYLVPSRLHRGKFYALPQSPQMYKQLLMAAGVDRYFQIARCFRDEDQRADRQPEFTQLDLEMSFAAEEDVFDVTEGVFAASFRAGIGVEVETSWERIKWRKAMSLYGSDKPDTRFDLLLIDLADIFREAGIFEDTIPSSAPGYIKTPYRKEAAFGICIPGGVSRKQLKELDAVAKDKGFGYLASVKIGPAGTLSGTTAKYFDEALSARLIGITKAQEGDMLVALAGEFETSADAMGSVRLKLAEILNVEKKEGFHFLWVTDFPLFEPGARAGELAPSHHPFTAPRLADVDKLEKAPLGVMSRAYDVVLNGVELGSGSVRIHEAELQRRVFRVLGYSDEEMESRFGFFLRALQYGVPPHAGVAPGLDRWVMMMCGEESIREVIAFPKTLQASSPMDGAPAAAAPAHLRELGLELVEGAGEET